MQALINTVVDIYQKFIAFFGDAFLSFKSFFEALFASIANYYDAFITYFNNVFLSLKLFLIDLPLVVLKKVFEGLMWVLQWVADSCSACIGSAGSSGELVTKFQSAFNAMASYSPGMMYVINRSGVPEAFQILTCGMTVWAAVKVFKFLTRS